jgi:hypothetical protein
MPGIYKLTPFMIDMSAAMIIFLSIEFERRIKNGNISPTEFTCPGKSI